MSRISHALFSAWLGAMACATVSAIMAFSKLDESVAADLAGPLFRAVDLYGIVVAGLYAAAHRGRRWRFLLSILTGLAAAANLFVVAPKVVERAEGFEVWHRAAEGIWTAILVAGLVLVLTPLSKQQKRT